MALSEFEINIKVGDIAAEVADAVVNAANAELWMGSGVAGSLKRAGGQVIEDEAVAKGPIPPGSAVVTVAGKLPARWVIHAVAIDEQFRGSPQLVGSATISALLHVEELALSDIAFPALGTGVGGLTVPQAAEAMRQGILDFSRKRTTKNIKKICFVLYDVASYNSFRQAFFAKETAG